MMEKELNKQMEAVLNEGSFYHLKFWGLRRVLPKLLEEIVQDEDINASDKECIILLADVVITLGGD